MPTSGAPPVATDENNVAPNAEPSTQGGEKPLTAGEVDMMSKLQDKGISKEAAKLMVREGLTKFQAESKALASGSYRTRRKRADTQGTSQAKQASMVAARVATACLTEAEDDDAWGLDYTEE